MTAPLRLVHQVQSRSVDWLHSGRDFGALPAGSAEEDLYHQPDEHHKPLGETALAATLVLRDGAAGTSAVERSRELLAWSWDQLGRGDLLYARLLRDPTLPDPLELYAHFHPHGYRHAKLDTLAGHSARLRSSRGAEVLPNRRLAVANARRRLGLGDGDDWHALADATWLGAVPEPWSITWMGGYHVTHAVFHLTDWGARPEGLPEHIAGYLAQWLPVWIDIWAETAQWDLVGELLATGACLPEPCVDAAAWEAVAASQHEDGMLPRDGEPVDEDPGQRFADHHHPTVVAAVASTLTLNRLLGAAR